MTEDEYRLRKENILDAYRLKMLTYIETRDALILLDTQMMNKKLREVIENKF